MDTIQNLKLNRLINSKKYDKVFEEFKEVYSEGKELIKKNRPQLGDLGTLDIDYNITTSEFSVTLNVTSLSKLTPEMGYWLTHGLGDELHGKSNVNVYMEEFGGLGSDSSEEPIEPIAYVPKGIMPNKPSIEFGKKYKEILGDNKDIIIQYQEVEVGGKLTDNTFLNISGVSDEIRDKIKKGLLNRLGMVEG